MKKPVNEPRPMAIEEMTAAAPMEERVIDISRVSRTQKGGRRIRFRAVVIVGNKQGVIGMGIGKASEIALAVTKATARAKRDVVTVPIVRQTIAHETIGHFGTARVLLKPAPAGTSVIAGSAVRVILELAGIENIVGKCLRRTTNKINTASATFAALAGLKDITAIATRPVTTRRQGPKNNGTSPPV